MRVLKASFIFLAVFLLSVITSALMHHAKVPVWLIDGFTSGVLGVAITFLVFQISRHPKA